MCYNDTKTAKKEKIMDIKIYQTLPPEAREIRTVVFVEEQGFQEEFDTTDNIATHLVLFHAQAPAAVCRVFFDEDMGLYLVGRVAVRKEFRGSGLGAAIMQAAEEQVRRMGGTALHLHAQCRITPFYEAIGYHSYGPIEDDQGCPHIWMKKELSQGIVGFADN
jgi:predicted GNAT family N-acyltransferase